MEETVEGLQWVAPVAAPALRPVVAPAAKAVAVAAPAAETNPTPALAAANKGGQNIYLRSITEQLTGWDNPKQRFW